MLLVVAMYGISVTHKALQVQHFVDVSLSIFIGIRGSYDKSRFVYLT